MPFPFNNRLLNPTEATTVSSWEEVGLCILSCGTIVGLGDVNDRKVQSSPETAARHQFPV